MRCIVQIEDPAHRSVFPLSPGDCLLNPIQIASALAAAGTSLPGSPALITNLFSTVSEAELPPFKEGTWEREYAYGLAKEVYIFPIPNSMDGMTFHEAAVSLYESHSVVLIGCDVFLHDKSSRSGMSSFLLLAPTGSMTTIVRKGGVAYAIAGDSKFIDEICDAEEGSPFQIRNAFQQIGNVLQEVSHASMSFFQTTGDHITQSTSARKEENGSVTFGGSGESTEMIRHAAGAYGEFVTNPSLYDAVVKQVPTRWRDTYDILDKPRNPKEVTLSVTACRHRQFHDHVIYIGPSRSALEFIAPLRCKGSPDQPTIAIVTTAEYSDETLPIVASWFERVYIVAGDGHKPLVLKGVGIKTARKIVILPRHVTQEDSKGHPQPTLEPADEFLSDSDAIFTARFVRHCQETVMWEREKVEEKRKEGGEGRMSPDIHVELDHGSNLKFLRSIRMKKKRRRVGWRIGRCLDLFIPETHATPQIHPTVCSGSVVFSAFVTQMLSTIAKSHGRMLTVLMLLLRLPAHPLQSKYTAHLSSLPLPPSYVGKNFRDLFIGLCRETPPSLTIALSRVGRGRRSEGEIESAGIEDVFRYVWACPSPGAVLRVTDIVFVLSKLERRGEGEGKRGKREEMGREGIRGGAENGDENEIGRKQEEGKEEDVEMG